MRVRIAAPVWADMVALPPRSITETEWFVVVQADAYARACVVAVRSIIVDGATG